MAKKQKKNVTFSDVHVRLYERILSDHPACRDGPAVGIGWQYEEAEAEPVSNFEKIRQQTSNPDCLVINRKQREYLLRNAGFSEQQMAAAVRCTNKVKLKRKQTIHNLRAQQVEEAVEKT